VTNHRFLRLRIAILVTVFCCVIQRGAVGQEAGTTVSESVVEPAPPGDAGSAAATKSTGKQPVASEIAQTNLVSYGNFKLFGAAVRCNIWTAGVEYDRHVWGRHLKAQVDYVVEVLPFVLLSEPASADKWGNPTSPYQQLVHGLGVSPFGFRFLWRSDTRVKPFLIGKLGVLAFPQKVLSQSASYANFNIQGEGGVQIKMTDRMDLRLVPLEYFHFSNGYLAASNPGFDELGVNFGISYHLGKPEH